MSQERISLDELLSKQAAPAKLMVTIEALAEPDLVKVTPFNSGARCSCDASLKVRKDAIDWVVASDEMHECCGKQLMVVEIGLKDPTLADVLGQLAANARARAPAAAARQIPARFAPFANSSRSRRQGPVPVDGSLAGLGISSPDELASGGFDPWACYDDWRLCSTHCATVYKNMPYMRALCACECENRRGLCGDPNYVPVDCIPPG